MVRLACATSSSRFLFPLVGGVILAVLFFTTLIDSMDPDYGSGSNIFGVGLVFVLGMVVLLGGAVIMIIAVAQAPGVLPGRDALAGLRRLTRAPASTQADLDMPASGEPGRLPRLGGCL